MKKTITLDPGKGDVTITLTRHTPKETQYLIGPDTVYGLAVGLPNARTPQTFANMTKTEVESLIQELSTLIGNQAPTGPVYRKNQVSRSSEAITDAKGNHLSSHDRHNMNR